MFIEKMTMRLFDPEGVAQHYSSCICYKDSTLRVGQIKRHRYFGLLNQE